MRRVSLNLSAPESDRRVTVDMAERGGRLHVAVRAGDGELTTALRQELGELVTRLEHAGYGAETWSPGAAGDERRGEARGDIRLAAARQDPPPDSSADERGHRSQPTWVEETRPKKNNRVEESFLWHLQSLR